MTQTRAAQSTPVVITRSVVKKGAFEPPSSHHIGGDDAELAEWMVIMTPVRKGKNDDGHPVDEDVAYARQGPKPPHPSRGQLAPTAAHVMSFHLGVANSQHGLPLVPTVSTHRGSTEDRVADPRIDERHGVDYVG